MGQCLGVARDPRDERSGGELQPAGVVLSKDSTARSLQALLEDVSILPFSFSSRLFVRSLFCLWSSMLGFVCCIDES
jgi:hypothetical protein